MVSYLFFGENYSIYSGMRKGCNVFFLFVMMKLEDTSRTRCLNLPETKRFKKVAESLWRLPSKPAFSKAIRYWNIYVYQMKEKESACMWFLFLVTCHLVSVPPGGLGWCFPEALSYIMWDMPRSGMILREQLSLFLMSQLFGQQTWKKQQSKDTPPPKKEKRMTMKSEIALWIETGTLEESNTSFLECIQLILQPFNGREKFLPDPKCLPWVMSINNISRTCRQNSYW